ncbi:fibronectin type III domain-containing protein [Maribacter sp. M208]|uniref:fibronectin type III domain-containing protein n=1 Tax=Maribacter huludaoensis TaxID=3030010 RepID=UPI0023EAFEC2|nr:fibronectin type III domain-containing protein [Maribacter huludaoensis]MDF4220214.1 fibronectin type III domain-containing protein [Maribacter huludaoensis]
MKYYLNFFYIFLILIVTGCSSDSTDDSMPEVDNTPDEITLSSFEIEFEDISQTSAKIMWTKVTASNNNAVSYSLFLDDELQAENLSELEYNVEELDINTTYAVKVVATADDAKDSINTSEFHTLGTPPSAFPITYELIACDVVRIKWQTPTVEDGSDYYYKIFINGEYHETYGSKTTETTSFTMVVTEGEEHTIKVIAISYSGAETEEEITFFREPCPLPTDFEVSISDITATSATISWTPSTSADGNTVLYLLTINGVDYPTENHFRYGTTKYITDLERNTNYEVVVTARAQNTYKTKESTASFTTSNDYPVHPDITITEAKLITPDSQYFPGQLNITFSEELANFEINKWVAIDYEIGNYSTYTSSVSSSVLSEENYNSLAADKTGYILIEVDGVVYQLNYEVTLETN